MIRSSWGRRTRAWTKHCIEYDHEVNENLWGIWDRRNVSYITIFFELHDARICKMFGGSVDERRCPEAQMYLPSRNVAKLFGGRPESSSDCMSSGRYMEAEGSSNFRCLLDSIQYSFVYTRSWLFTDLAFRPIIIVSGIQGWR